MVFSSHIFILVFLPLVSLLYFFFLRKNINVIQIFLLLASIFFYSYFNFWNFFLLLFSCLFNFYIAKKVKEKFYLYFSVLINLFFLSLFKYHSTFIFLANSATQHNFQELNIILPLAISFYTLQQIGYQFDIHFGTIKRCKNFIKYFLFLSFFPQLIAGPIIHYHEVSKGFNSQNQKQFKIKKRILGLILFSIGLSKKVLIADQISFYSNLLFDGYSNNEIFQPNFIASWSNTLVYSFQLYFDFSGYSDMAVGLGMIYGIILPYNFFSPYKSTTIVEFWQRWHITLSKFINTYFYILILKTTGTNFTKVIIFTFLSFLLIGIWHGPKINYLYFGLIQAFLVIIYRFYSELKIRINFKGLNKYFSIFLTFICINFSLVFFRSENPDVALSILRGLLGFNGMGLYAEYYDRLFFFKYLYNIIGGYRVSDPTYYFYGMRNIYILFPLIFIVFFLPNSQYIINYISRKLDKYPVVISIITSFLFYFSIIGITEIKEFIYFQF